MRTNSPPLVGLLLATLILGACATATPPTPVPITDYRMVAGKWEGLVSGLAGTRNEDDAVQLTIGEDGAYDFGIYRTIGVFAGKGALKLQDGKLLMQGERGHATYALYETDGRRYLRAEGVLRSGMPVSGRFKPVP